VEILLQSLEILPLDKEADRHYAEIRWQLECLGTPIGPNDLLIAAHALALDLIVITDNVEEYARVPGLSIDNWLE
jgi:tRNA(fMet)-specific endonuclease VapC